MLTGRPGGIHVTFQLAAGKLPVILSGFAHRPVLIHQAQKVGSDPIQPRPYLHSFMLPNRGQFSHGNQPASPSCRFCNRTLTLQSIAATRKRTLAKPRQPKRCRSSSRVNRESPDAGDRTGQSSQPTPSDLLNHGLGLGCDATTRNTEISDDRAGAKTKENLE